ncbi:hypothetical protein NPIL_577111 [Nephila pilipes]|uniref:Peptidase aspartic putative domain-containing protein n=1 Tax=Nephila pilipes TaxID=299642 RepID=A0A8X6TM52_NEPPI|nr:hypothetical protein NPIL_577111 [Nephila pilipes]
MIIIEALEIDEVLTSPKEFAPIDVINELKIKGINLCDFDYSFLGRENISLLIGAYHYFNIVSKKIRHLNPKLAAIESKFGWLLMGERKLDTLVIRGPIEVQSRKEREIAALNCLKGTVTLNNEGRYEVHLPCVADHGK